jgi:predicted MFS family arabinose efflux permease
MTTISPRQRLLVYAMGGVGLGTNAFIYFLVPLRAYEMGVGIGTIGLLLGTKSLTEAIMSVPIGAFIDRVGPRRAVLFGSCGVALAGVAFAVAPSVLLLFAIQLALGLVRPMAWIGGQAYAAGMRGEAHRGQDTGRFSFGANVGQMVTPLVAGLAVELSGTRTAFAIMAAYGLGFVVIAWVLPDVARSSGHGASSDRSGYLPAVQLLRRRNIRVDLILTFTRLWLPSTWSSFLPVYLVSVGTSAAVAGSVSATMAVVATSVSLLAGQVTRIGSPTLMTAAVLGMSAVGVTATPLLTSVPLVYVSALLVGIGQGLSLPLLLVLVSTSAPPGQRSLALGLRSSVNQVAATASPVLTAQVIALTSLGVGFALSGGLAVLFLATAVLLHRRPGHDPGTD